MAVQPKILYCRWNYQSIKKLEDNSCYKIPPEVICYKKLLLKADAFGTILIRLSLRDSRQSAPVKIKHLAAKYSCIWGLRLIFFLSVKRHLHRGFILYSDLELDRICSSFLSARQCPEQWLQQNLLAFKEYFLIRHLHPFLVENSDQKNLPLT